MTRTEQLLDATGAAPFRECMRREFITLITHDSSDKMRQELTLVKMNALLDGWNGVRFALEGTGICVAAALIGENESIAFTVEPFSRKNNKVRMHALERTTRRILQRSSRNTMDLASSTSKACIAEGISCTAGKVAVRYKSLDDLMTRMAMTPVRQVSVGNFCIVDV